MSQNEKIPQDVCIFYFWTLHFQRKMSQNLSFFPLEFFFPQTTSSIYSSGWNWDHTSITSINHPIIIQVLMESSGSERGSS